MWWSGDWDGGGSDGIHWTSEWGGSVTSGEVKDAWTRCLFWRICEKIFNEKRELCSKHEHHMVDWEALWKIPCVQVKKERGVFLSEGGTMSRMCCYHGCFNLLMEKVVREVNARVLEWEVSIQYNGFLGGEGVRKVE